MATKSIFNLFATVALVSQIGLSAFAADDVELTPAARAAASAMTGNTTEEQLTQIVSTLTAEDRISILATMVKKAEADRAAIAEARALGSKGKMKVAIGLPLAAINGGLSALCVHWIKNPRNGGIMGPNWNARLGASGIRFVAPVALGFASLAVSGAYDIYVSAEEAAAVNANLDHLIKYGKALTANLQRKEALE